MKKITLLLVSLLFTLQLTAQELEKNALQQLIQYFKTYGTEHIVTKGCQLDSLKIQHSARTLTMYVSKEFAYQPFTEENVATIYTAIKELLPGPLNYYEHAVIVDSMRIEELIPNLYRTNRPKDRSRRPSNNPKSEQWVRNLSRPYKANKGLEGRHIALWQSHGRYYNVTKKEWEWQRPKLFCTTEDLFTQSFVTPYLIPMLENAGAVVFTPRERDTQRNEVIVDNDQTKRVPSMYIEQKSKKARWTTLPNQPAFANPKPTYTDKENPFKMGTARYTRTEKQPNRACVVWMPEIPEAGNYAVYVTYVSQPESVSDAKYTVFHKGGSTTFQVNQKIGGGTWAYLGTFPFAKGRSNKNMVLLSNQSEERGIVCADAVRFGGGLGNIARSNHPDEEAQTSGLARNLEGARYWAQWAGMPYKIYSKKEGTDDYSDDINARSLMENYLAGQSTSNPKEEGLGIPFDVSLALHSDAGHNVGDSLIGSLAVYTTRNDSDNCFLPDGTSRYASRDLADIVLTELQKDIKANYPIEWPRRAMWDRNYSETRLPNVPSMILELLSHQNFKDMTLGHDPKFKFIAARSIYKSLVRFVNSQHHKSYTIQPLPVDHFQIQLEEDNKIQLKWHPVGDPTEPTATAKRYIVYTRIGGMGFDNGIVVRRPNCTIKIRPGYIYSFKITAVNDGGESFPSEILTAYIDPNSDKKALIINGFDRLSGPAIIDTAEKVGFNLQQSPGIAYGKNISLSGAQKVFDRSHFDKKGEEALGHSEGTLEGVLVAGNTFDYAYVHGKAIQEAGGYSFVSCSDEAVESEQVSLYDYNVVDYILGMEHESNTSYDSTLIMPYKTFTPRMRKAITNYCSSGGNIMVSGSFIGRDMQTTDDEIAFTHNILKYDYKSALSNQLSGEIKGLNKVFNIIPAANEKTYSVSSADCIESINGSFSVLAYLDQNYSAGTAYKGTDYKTFIMGFPFESVTSINDRTYLMIGILNFFKQ